MEKEPSGRIRSIIPANTLFLRVDLDIRLLCGLPCPLVAGRDAEVEKLVECGIDFRADNQDLGPDHLGIERVAEVVGELLADRVPVGLRKRVVPLIIIPDRAGMDPDKIRDGDMFCRAGTGVFLAIIFGDRPDYTYGRLILSGQRNMNCFLPQQPNQISMTAQEISVNIPPTLDPVYSNMIQIAYKDDEFTFMFLHQLPQVNQARAKAIVSITPSHAKNLLGVLTKTVADYEGQVRDDRAKRESRVKRT